MSWNRHHRLIAAGICITLLLLAALFLPFPSVTSVPVEHVIEVQAHSFGFSPARTRIGQGDTVTLVLRSQDVTHGLYLDDYAVNLVSVPGTSQQTTFAADQAGLYRYRCSVTCGTLHPFMIGQLEVTPNRPYLRGLALTVAVAVGAFLSLWAWEPSAGSVA